MGKLEKRKTSKRSPELTDYKAWGKQLRRAFKKAFGKAAASESTLRPRKRGPNAFKLSAYRYLRELKHANLIEGLREYVEERDGTQWKGRGESDELWVLRLATKGKQIDQKRATRYRWAPELRLADLNDVQPGLLLGFLYEAGAGAIIKKDARDAVRYDWAECYQENAPTKRSRSAQARPRIKGPHTDDE